MNGQTIKIQAQGDIEMAAAAINTAQTNKKEIILGQRMTFGAGEDTDLQFDPRASKNILSQVMSITKFLVNINSRNCVKCLLMVLLNCL